MDLETTHVIEQLGGRIDRLEIEMRDGFASVREELRTEIGGLRTEVGDLGDRLDTNWAHTQILFESLGSDVQMLAGHVADLASRLPRR